MADKKDKLPSKPTTGTAVDAFLNQVSSLAPTKPAGSGGRLIFAMDATASREPTWDQASHIQAEMFQQTTALGGLKVQLLFFRGFMELLASPWVSDANTLLRKMTAVRCLAGETQLGRVFLHALGENRRHKVDALVYVGDCFEENIDKVGKLAGELGLNGLPAFIFHEGNEPVARGAFQQFARLSGGAYCPFDRNSADTLRDLLGAVAVYAAGGRRALADHARKHGGAVALLEHQVKK